MSHTFLEQNLEYLKELLKNILIKLQAKEISREDFALYYTFFKFISSNGTNEIGMKKVIELGKALTKVKVLPQELSGLKEDIQEELEVMEYLFKR